MRVQRQHRWGWPARIEEEGFVLDSPSLTLEVAVLDSGGGGRADELVELGDLGFELGNLEVCRLETCCGRQGLLPGCGLGGLGLGESLLNRGHLFWGALFGLLEPGQGVILGHGRFEGLGGSVVDPQDATLISEALALGLDPAELLLGRGLRSYELAADGLLEGGLVELVVGQGRGGEENSKEEEETPHLYRASWGCELRNSLKDNF
ncbi:MAG: hypothetical protein UW63_C0074G0007 [Candidatus Uhrbacteria bacterium GW2011_GWF2_44_350]|uniref:Uncharacterized protein n=1 Tax=Candidatus Uhrbacteria bacterium GW2011_GWF2_44_350 TaxID=1619000 RepID=A0A0G1LIA6_9BACT|nr:MAG: hypothetical protein UW63_C0074G0007 [Candidatus Uhrbacteria bacterium GW2011_GWF2_44_350]